MKTHLLLCNKLCSSNYSFLFKKILSGDFLAIYRSIFIKLSELMPCYLKFVLPWYFSKIIYGRKLSLSILSARFLKKKRAETFSDDRHPVSLVHHYQENISALTSSFHRKEIKKNIKFVIVLCFFFFNFHFIATLLLI